MRMTRHIGTPTSYEKIEITALVRLQHVINIQLSIPARIRRGNCLYFGPISETRGKFRIADVKMQLATKAVQLDPVAFLHDRQRTAGTRLGRYMQHHSAVRG